MQKHKHLFLWINFINVLSGILADECKREDCPGDQKLYEELNCKPVLKDGNCCPVKYECPDLYALDKEKCHFNGKEYDLSQDIDTDETSGHCAAACKCNKNEGDEHAVFTCAHIDCPEHLGPHDPECVNKYELNKCCSTDKICGEAKDQLHKCYFDGKEYLDGSQIYPDSVDCHKCICKPDFDNSTVVGNKNCQKLTCALPLLKANNLLKGCAPVYFDDNKCCPIGWRCPDPVKDVVIAEGRSDQEEACTFGDLKVHIGGKLKTSSAEVTCECITPPYIQCVQENTIFKSF